MRKPTAYTALRNTGLYHEYTRMSALDPRVAPIVKELLPYASYQAPGDSEPLLIKELREAIAGVRHHFRDSDPDIAASLARKDFMTALLQLRATLPGEAHNGEICQ